MRAQTEAQTQTAALMRADENVLSVQRRLDPGASDS